MCHNWYLVVIRVPACLGSSMYSSSCLQRAWVLLHECCFMLLMCVLAGLVLAVHRRDIRTKLFEMIVNSSLESRIAAPFDPCSLESAGSGEYYT